MKLWELTAGEIVMLPDDGIALLVLEAFGVSGWNVDSFFKESARAYPVYRQQGVADRVAVGWAWLEAHGLIRPNPEQSSSPNARRVTRAGRGVLKGGLGRLRLAAFVALRERSRSGSGLLRAGQRLGADLELAKQELAPGLSAESIGVGLMAAAFNPKAPGPLADPAAEWGEQEAGMALFRGAIGTFKNPSSHRAVDYDDPILASDVVPLADLLMRLLDQVEGRLGGSADSSWSVLGCLLEGGAAGEVFGGHVSRCPSLGGGAVWGRVLALPGLWSAAVGCGLCLRISWMTWARPSF